MSSNEEFLKTLAISDTNLQWKLFSEFIRYKLMVGEPSPHMTMVGYMSKDCPWKEKVWRAGCYGAPYSVLTAEILWTFWPLERMLKHREDFLPWLREHWPGLHTRTERRCVRTPEKFAVNLTQYADWLVSDLPQVLQNASGDKRVFYDELWESITSVKFMGRYISIRIIELLRRFCGVDAPLYDIRSIGGWSPKQCLTLFDPDRAGRILSPVSSVSSAASDEVGEEILQKLKQMEGLENLDYYVFAAMLCEYREAFQERKQYPARTIDQELEYHGKISAFWKARGFSSKLFEVRKAIFPHECLGEINGWKGIRHNLGRTVRDYEYNWCDLVYNYQRSSDNLEEPVSW